VALACQHYRQNCAVRNIATAGRDAPAPATGAVVSYGGGCQAFTKDLHRVVWPAKFRPDLPQRYDGTANPVEFLHLYTVSVQAAGGNDKAMANWFPMGLKDATRSWLMNLPEESIATWGELCEQFIANFSATYDRPCTKNDLRAVVQRSKETLRKFIQRFSQVRNKIPRITDVEIICAFSAGVTDVRMCEKLGMRDNLSSAVELFELVDKCAKAKEGRLFAHNVPDADTDAKLTKAKSASKRKPAAVLATETEQKYRHKGEGSA
jgi:hypothetical protein